MNQEKELLLFYHKYKFSGNIVSMKSKLNPDDKLEKMLAGIKASMSRNGNCYDNAFAESFFATLKKELIYRENFKAKEEAKKAIFEYIEVWYNRQRIHSSIRYISPVQFEEFQAA